MLELGIRPAGATVEDLGIVHGVAHWNIPPDALIAYAHENEGAQFTDTGALTVDTGEFTGRSPKDKFTVKDDITAGSVWWNDFNIPFSSEQFDLLYIKMIHYLNGKQFFIRDVTACADTRYTMRIRVLTEYAWSSLFVHNMFLRPSAKALETFTPEWHVINAPGFRADPLVDGTRQHNFSMLDFKRKIILIGGSAYTGEIKKSVFTALNFILPQQRNVLSIHGAANVGAGGDTAIFFGLSGTGKTTLSADPERKLIGDDEHGWTDDHVIFNIEGGCYAKTINLREDKEPDIFHAITTGALLENTVFFPDTSAVDYDNARKTENTRVSYPLEHIRSIATPAVGKNPRNIFFLTCDAYGILPPISRLTPEQAAFHFISGYTAKVAGTEAGVSEPAMTFSACFGAPFMPLHPTRYAEMLSQRMQEADATVWLVNTGWSGGGYGTGKRMGLPTTRTLISAALKGWLDDVLYTTHDVFGIAFPTHCPNVPQALLNPRNTWPDKDQYDKKANYLAECFLRNFEKYAAVASKSILRGAPRIHA